MAKNSAGIQNKLMELLELNKAPLPPDVDLPAWVTKPDEENSVDLLASQLYAFHYNQALSELEKPEQAVKSAAVRAKVAAQAMTRVLQNLDASSEVIERTAAYIIYVVSETGLWTHDVSEPSTIEEWLLIQLSSEKITRTYRSYYNFLLTTLIPYLRNYGTQEQINALFAVKDNWRRAQATLPELRKAIDLVEATETVYNAKIAEQANTVSEIQSSLMSTDLSGEQRKRIEETKEREAKKLKDLRDEASSKITEQRGDLNVLVDVAAEVITQKGSVNTDEIKMKLYQGFSEKTGKQINSQYIPKIYKGTLCHMKDGAVLYMKVPAGVTETIETLTRGTVDFVAGDHDGLFNLALEDISPKHAAKIFKRYFKNLDEEGKNTVQDIISGLWE